MKTRCDAAYGLIARQLLSGPTGAVENQLKYLI